MNGRFGAYVLYDTVVLGRHDPATLLPANLAKVGEALAERIGVEPDLPELQCVDISTGILPSTMESAMRAGEGLYVVTVGKLAEETFDRFLRKIATGVQAVTDPLFEVVAMPPIESWGAQRATLFPQLLRFFELLHGRSLEDRAASRSRRLLEAGVDGSLATLDFTDEEMLAVLATEVAAGRTWLVRARSFGTSRYTLELVDGSIRLQDPVEEALILLVSGDDPAPFEERARAAGYQNLVPMQPSGVLAVFRWLAGREAGQEILLRVASTAGEEAVAG